MTIKRCHREEPRQRDAAIPWRTCSAGNDITLIPDERLKT
jgi:hypothetical protein